MQAVFQFLSVALVVEGEEAVEDGAAGGLAQRVALALLGGVEAVAQVQIAPAVGGGHGLIHLLVQRPQPRDVRRLLAPVVEAVVGLRQPFLLSLHDLAAMLMVTFANSFKTGQVSGERKCFKRICVCIARAEFPRLKNTLSPKPRGTWTEAEQVQTLERKRKQKRVG